MDAIEQHKAWVNEMVMRPDSVARAVAHPPSKTIKRKPWDQVVRDATTTDEYREAASRIDPSFRF